MTNSKTPGLSDELHAYLVAHASPLDPVVDEIAEATRARFPELMSMVVAPEQAAFLTLLTRLLDVKLAVEVGTFTGTSALAIARGLAPGGRLICLDISTEFTTLAREFWERANVADRIDLRIGDGVVGLRGLGSEPPVDLAFVDAHKPQYIDYYEQLVPRLAERGVIIVDNVLWSGAVIDDDDQSENTVAIRAFNDHVAADPRVEAVMLPIADGLTFISRRR